METRRGKLDQLSTFFKSIGESVDSTARLQGGAAPASSQRQQGDAPHPIDANAAAVDAVTQSAWEKHIPTFRKRLKRLTTTFVRL